MERTPLLQGVEIELETYRAQGKHLLGYIGSRIRRNLDLWVGRACLGVIAACCTVGNTGVERTYPGRRRDVAVIS